MPEKSVAEIENEFNSELLKRIQEPIIFYLNKDEYLVMKRQLNEYLINMVINSEPVYFKLGHRIILKMPKVKYNPQPIPRACHACGEIVMVSFCPYCCAYNELEYEHEPPTEFNPEDDEN